MNESFFYSVLNKAGLPAAEKLVWQPIGGGCINQAARVSLGDQSYFIKWQRGHADMFEKEKAGLQLLKKNTDLGIPEVYVAGEAAGNGYLLMDYIEPGRQSSAFWKDLGVGLAYLHQASQDQFGLEYDNYIGRLPQQNARYELWCDFFVECRLKPQVRAAFDKSLIDRAVVRQFELFYHQLPGLIPEEPPALLHGDLWSGNIHASAGSSPYLIDPAVYYGHREAELAFTTLFGGFDDLFYQAYQEVFPLQEGYQYRIDIFNLYPLLVHVNLFGSSYLQGVQQTLDKYTG